ncbi:MAG: hypothetical protein COV31_00090 [Candidatus Yanofskybacteria bacterium CG10_big_fil_rev_8_21_14_0_10_46_23]|uniref:Polysaccharide biosynthesis protein C-terminal domain-containing protein n=1 Tax=Candidatus Yanofskybacteria bacterium CG10_big_fil_rev_8_21_14_0_10_46_23 TaxID=1975098 RepID=A0A2H0R539_9BACT|nr:MAG: hypothetical protein COV31_00090 [Candidatus Yanofskybacteria bacterium CG10_big_fil_rev_8_21_14_0_10_46_23]
MNFRDIRERLLRLKEKQFVQDTATLQVGTVVGNFTQAIVGIFLARILQPELFGIYSLALSLAGFAALFIGIGAHEAITTVLSEAYEKKDKTEVNYALAFLIKLISVSGFIAIGGALIAPFISKLLYQNSSIGSFASISIIGLFISATLLAMTRIVLQVINKIKLMTGLIVLDQLVRSGLSLFLAVVGFGVLGAVTGHLLGAVVIFFVAMLVWQRVQSNFPLIPSLKFLLKLWPKVSIRRYLNFSIWITVDRNIANVFVILPVILTGIFVSAQEVTFFKLAFGYINLALSLLAPISILLNVEFPKQKVRDFNALAANFIRISMYSLITSTILTVGAVLISPVAFVVLYGENFSPSVQYVYGLIIYGAMMGIGVGLGPMWRAINKVRVSIIINLVTLIIGIPVGLFLIRSYGSWGTVAMVTAWFTASQVVSFIYLARFLKSKKPILLDRPRQ